MRTRPSGFTLVELLTTVTVVSTLTAVAIPGLSGLLQGQRERAGLQSLQAVLMQARGLAVQRGQRLGVCPSADGERCRMDREWAGGALVFVDHNQDRQRQANEPVVHDMQALDRLRIRSNAGRPVVVFHPDGSSTGFNATFHICNADTGVSRRSLILANSGRLRIGGAGSCV